MQASNSVYRRIGRQGATLTQYVRLYLGPDHLLQVFSTGYSESYKRFYFRDIQAIIIRKTALWIFWILFWLIPGLILALAAISSDGTAAIVLWIITGVVFLGLMFNILLGPTCACHIRTAVQTEKLPSLKRLSKARWLLHEVRPLLESAQGKLTADDLAENRREAAAGQTETPAPTLPLETPSGGPSSITQHPSSNPAAAPPIIDEPPANSS